MSDMDEGTVLPESETAAAGAADSGTSAADAITDLWDTDAPASGGSVLDELNKAGGGHLFDPPVDYDELNRQQAAARERDIAAGVDPLIATLSNPDIDPANPDRIN
jgi:hypothetical protein